MDECFYSDDGGRRLRVTASYLVAGAWLQDMATHAAIRVAAADAPAFARAVLEAAGRDDVTVTAPDSAPEPTVARWEGTVVRTDDPGEDTVVCCTTADGRPVALALSEESAEALAGALLDTPDGEEVPPALDEGVWGGTTREERRRIRKRRAG